MNRSEILILLEEELVRSPNFLKGGAPELSEEILSFLEDFGIIYPNGCTCCSKRLPFDKVICDECYEEH